MKRIDKVYEILRQRCSEQYYAGSKISGISAGEISRMLNTDRANISSDLNKLFRSGKICRMPGKPVLYRIKEEDVKLNINKRTNVFDSLIGSSLSLKNAVDLAKIAIIYPPKGFNTLIIGETGTGKSMFAKIMYEYAKEVKKEADMPFVTFNCSDYCNNPQLLMSILFGVKKGTYTGAEYDRYGLVEKADGGILFLDEVHRLPPEGQEMLFYLMDNGLYRRLGETECHHKAKVLIICATTENIESSLLSTFIRRIPIIISLPPLRDRSYKERFDLIISYFKAEAHNINADVSVSIDVLRALMLYDCPKNIGQLINDIRISCAKAFLRYIVEGGKYVKVEIDDLPSNVKEGLYQYKDKKQKIDGFVRNDIILSSKLDQHIEMNENSQNVNFYEIIENKKRKLEEEGIDKKDIELLINIDIEKYLNENSYNAEENNFEDLYKVVDKRVVEIVEDFIIASGRILSREFSNKLIYSLAIHVSAAIERVKKGDSIINSNIEIIKKQYSAEFNISDDLRRKLEDEFKIKIPEDETGNIAMFLCLDNQQLYNSRKTAVIVAMHGDTTATSMADVANKLLAANFVVGYNMPLSKKPYDALNDLISIVKRTNQGKGILMLVDMGSLVFFGDMIQEKTGIPIRTVDMVSTPLVIEAARKALMNASLEEIYKTVKYHSLYFGKLNKEAISYNESSKDDVVITACITGEGAAVKIKNILEKRFKSHLKDINIITLNILGKEEFIERIITIKSKKNVLAVVSAIEPNDPTILYISTSELFEKEKNSTVEFKINSVKGIKTVYDMKNAVKENIDIDCGKYIESFLKFYLHIVNNHIPIDHDIISNLVLHFACIIEKIEKGINFALPKVNIEIPQNMKEKYQIIIDAIKTIEDDFNIKFDDAEYVNIARVIMML